VTELRTLPVVFSGDVADLTELAYAGMSGLAPRFREPDLITWNENCRLYPGRGAAQRLDDPRVASAFASLMTNTGPALRNLKQRAMGAPAAG